MLDVSTTPSVPEATPKQIMDAVKWVLSSSAVAAVGRYLWGAITDRTLDRKKKEVRELVAELSKFLAALPPSEGDAQIDLARTSARKELERAVEQLNQLPSKERADSIADLIFVKGLLIFKSPTLLIGLTQLIFFFFLELALVAAALALIVDETTLAAWSMSLFLDALLTRMLVISLKDDKYSPSGILRWLLLYRPKHKPMWLFHVFQYGLLVTLTTMWALLNGDCGIRTIAWPALQGVALLVFVAALISNRRGDIGEFRRGVAWFCTFTAIHLFVSGLRVCPVDESRPDSIVMLLLAIGLNGGITLLTDDHSGTPSKLRRLFLLFPAERATGWIARLVFQTCSIALLSSPMLFKYLHAINWNMNQPSFTAEIAVVSLIALGTLGALLYGNSTVISPHLIKRGERP
jgi:hypothetical protein